MFDKLSKAKSNAKSQLRPAMDYVKVVQLDDGKFDVVTPSDEYEPCLEQTIGEWTWGNLDKLWADIPNYNSDRLSDETKSISA
jgi:hypothetical protein